MIIEENLKILIAFLRELKLIFYSTTKNKCIFSREKTKAGQRYLDLDLSRSLVLIRWIADDILSLLNTYYIFICSYKYLKNYILTEYKIEHIASLVI